MATTISIHEKEQNLHFIQDNFNQLSQREIARKLKIGKTTVNRWSAELGLRYQKPTANEEFFDSFSEPSSYLLGLIYADGNVAWNHQKGYYNLTITSSAKDKDHLEDLRSLMSSTKPLLYGKSTDSYRLIINSKKLCSRLMELGVYPKKSLTLLFPIFLLIDQLPHFLRGVIDGDGNVRYVSRKRSSYFEITVSSGSLKFLEGFRDAVRKAINIVGGIRRVGINTFVLQYSCLRGEKLAEFIYADSTIHLSRKFEAYKKCLEVKKNGSE